MDFLTPSGRSERMSRIRSRNTGPELELRKRLHRLGFRYRIHYANLPGRPDIAFPSRKIVIFVHGCFWHGHHCKIGHTPKSNTEFWTRKIKTNADRDAKRVRQLRRLGWRVLTVWECGLGTIRKTESTLRAVARWIDSHPPRSSSGDLSRHAKGTAKPRK